jgi:hypothetical protein
MAEPPSSTKETLPGLYRYLILLIGFVTLAGAGAGGTLRAVGCPPCLLDLLLRQEIADEQHIEVDKQELIPGQARLEGCRQVA